MNEQIVPALRVADAARAVAWYRRLAFTKDWEHQFGPGFPWFVSVERGDVRVYLSEHKGGTRPTTLIHLYVMNHEVVPEEFGIHVNEEGLAGRECELVDPDGNRLRVAQLPTTTLRGAGLKLCRRGIPCGSQPLRRG